MRWRVTGVCLQSQPRSLQPTVCSRTAHILPTPLSPLITPLPTMATETPLQSQTGSRSGGSTAEPHMAIAAGAGGAARPRVAYIDKVCSLETENIMQQLRVIGREEVATASSLASRCFTRLSWQMCNVCWITQLTSVPSYR